MSEPVWMRIRRGRVMHAVRPWLPGWFKPVCRRIVGAPAEDWITENLLDYPKCQHCERDT